MPVDVKVVSVLQLFIACTLCNQYEKRLHSELMQRRGYNKLIRPSAEGEEALVVKLGMRLSQLLEVVSSVFITYLYVVWFAISFLVAIRISNV